MIKRTLYFGNPAHLYMRNGQLCISAARKSETDDESKVITVPIEDIGVVVIDHEQITLTHMLISSLLDNNAAIVTCDNTHHPQGLLLPLSMNSLQTEKFKAQIAASEPLKKQLWAQTVSAKLKNQAAVLQKRGKGDIAKKLNHFAKEVKSGDGDNHEAQGAALYWQHIFEKGMNFRRERFGEPPNNVLNYGYSILRAIVARSLVASGALPTLGIFHRNKYNAYCLADDIMEPYRPYVDELVCKILDTKRDYTDLNKEIKQELLQVPAVDIMIEGERSPLLVGLQRTTSSLMKCFEGEAKKVLYPELI